MSTHSTGDRTDLAVLREVLAAVSGRPALAPLHATASALLADLDTAGAEDPTTVPPGEIPDVDVPHVTKPRIDQPLGDPPGYSPLGGTPTQVPREGIVDAELVDDSAIDGAIGGGVSAGFSNHESPTGYTDQGVPTWDSVRDKVEGRSATAIGAEELDHSSPAGRTLDEQWNDREAAGRKKLDEIRRSMKAPSEHVHENP
ncbi:hypothetical protein [Rhodococcoides kyotonense]|uniref:Uncharacterized protein n=1 Tax=Rhodococcoides kyotonense TaxID=398843 RepID=A0A239KPJ1_9NOCA|nr:hypothetical protein [Rhodococcus kyotonensis]SNT20297.1 hypothetical protein SAMN05421642_11116 [Rhodococcus kyotonensis]